MEIKSEKPFLNSWVRGAVIGTGAFATVSLAFDKLNGELFAVKSMPSASHLETEYSVLNSLESPYIVKCLGKDYSTENGVQLCNLFMEYMPGGTVADLMNKFGGHLDESVIRGFTHGILLGLNYLHMQGIVHCDIKGKNLLVGASGVVKLGDFGSARRGDDKGFSIKDLRGTPLWMAPEVVNLLEQGPPSDIWSAGCTVFEMATGRPPWSNVSNPLAAICRIGCTDELPELPQCLSPQGRDFLEKCLRRDPKQRWTAAQLLNHPFLDEGYRCSASDSQRCPLSPTSTLDFGGADWDLYSSIVPQTVPIPPLEIPTPGRNESVERPSPRDRILALATGCKRPDWCANPSSGHWIAVRPNFPLSNNLVTSSKPTQGFFSFEDGDGERLPHCACEICGLEASGEERQHECKVASTSRKIKAPSIDEVREFYENRLEHIASNHCFRALSEEIRCVGREFCGLCSFVYDERRCPMRQCYISSISDTPPCNLISLLIPVAVAVPVPVPVPIPFFLISIHFSLSTYVLFVFSLFLLLYFA